LTPEDSGSIEVTLADFPKGAQAGTCVHTVYEHLDFEDPTMVRALCDTTLARFGFDAEMWAQPLSSGVIESLQTTLCSERALKLEGVAQQDRFDELDFTLVTHPTEGATSFALAEAMATLSESTCVRAYAEQLGRLSFDPVRGFLVGSIDLVFRSNGRFYVVDYKSNHLGRTRDSYAEQALNHAMMSHHYILQYHLYTVALHRYLSWRIPDYDYERDMGGVFYLFLRGMHPSTGPSRGVYSDRPSAALILALDRLLRGEP
jgi:exodeoxyribonuclease V beta subunit